MDAIKVIQNLIDEKHKLELRQKEIEASLAKAREIVNEYFGSSLPATATTSSSSSSSGRSSSSAGAAAASTPKPSGKGKKAKTPRGSTAASSSEQPKKKTKKQADAKTRGRVSTASSASAPTSATPKQKKHVVKAPKTEPKVNPRVSLKAGKRPFQIKMPAGESAAAADTKVEEYTGPFRVYSDAEVEATPLLEYINKQLLNVLEPGQSHRICPLRQRLSHLSDEDWAQLKPVILQNIATLTIEIGPDTTTKRSLKMRSLTHTPSASVPLECWCQGKWCGKVKSVFTYKQLCEILESIYSDIPESDTTE